MENIDGYNFYSQIAATVMAKPLIPVHRKITLVAGWLYIIFFRHFL
jgi:hypothetical protein